jgi:hypothetical protein
VLACIKRIAGNGAVHGIVGKDMDNGNRGIGEKLVIVGVYFGVFVAVFVFCILGALGDNVAKCGKLNLFYLGKGGQMLAVGNTAATDYT